MRNRFFTVFLVLLSALFLSSTTRAVEFQKGSPSTNFRNQELGIVMRLIGGKGAVLNSGKELKLTFRINQPGYVVIYNIDTDGFINLIYPLDGKLKRAEKSKVYTLPQRGSNLVLKAGRKTGIEYIHALAVSDVNDIDARELYFLSQDYKLARDKRFRTDIDPYLSFNMIDKTIVKDIDNNPPASDHTYFFVNKRVDYPSYLCGQCHGTDKFIDPNGRECTEIAIEKNFYETKVGYPYPPLFNITHYYEEAENNNYSYTSYYEDNLSNDWDDELLFSDDDDNDIYLTINYGYGYDRYHSPFYYSVFYPYNYYYWYPSYSYIDSYYWGFGFSWGYDSWYGNYYPYSWYGYHYPYAWYRPHYRHHNYCWNNPYNGRRSLYASRKFTKHNLSYQTSADRIRQKQSLADSKLVERRATKLTSKDRSQSGLSRILTPNQRSSSGRITNLNGTRYRDTVKRRVIYGSSNIRNSTRTTYNPRTGKKSTEARRTYNSDNIRTGNRRSSTEPRRSPVETRRSKSYTGNKTRQPRSVDKTRSGSKKSPVQNNRTQSTGKSSTQSRSSGKSTSSRTNRRSSSSNSSRSKSSSGSKRSSSSGKSNRSNSRGRR